MKARILQLDWTSGNEIELLENGADFFPALCRAIDGAQRSVHLETYIFILDRTGREVLASLVAACKRGIKVKVVVDGFGSAGTGVLVQTAIREAGGLCLIYRPEPKWFARWVPSRQRLRRLHRKLAVIDSFVAFVGGINIVDDYDDLDPTSETSVPRFDYAVAVKGPIVSYVVHAQRLLWVRLNWARVGKRPQSWRKLDLMRPHRHNTAVQGGMRAALVLRDNLRFRSTFEQAYLYAIESAERDILIANAYFLPGQTFQRALIDAARRGVRVRVLVQGKVEYHTQYHATRSLYEPLLADGVEIYEYAPSYLHAKVAVIDDRATVGSSNIDPFSFMLAREANVWVDDAAFAQSLRQSLDAAIERGGHRIVAKTYHARGWWRRVVDRAAYGMVRMGISFAEERSKE